MGGFYTGGMESGGGGQGTVNKSPWRIFPLGDSITQGKVPADGAYRIPMWASSVSAGYPITYVGTQNNGPGWDAVNSYVTSETTLGSHHHEGHSGWRIADIQSWVQNARLVYEFQPDVTVLHIGINDVTENASQGTKDAFSAAYASTLNTLLTDMPNGQTTKVFAMNLIRSTGDAAWQTAVGIYRALISAQIALSPLVTELDPYTTTFVAATDTLDGTHPNAGGYSILNTQLMWPAVLAYISQ